MQSAVRAMKDRGRQWPPRASWNPTETELLARCRIYVNSLGK